MLRPRAGGGDELCVVHRPKYDDWSLPKGKLNDGETWEQGALREVEEETGHRCEIERELAPSRYTDGKGRSKEVHWFRMRPVGGRFTPSEEVDELRWVGPDEVAALLDYPHDRRLVSSL